MADDQHIIEIKLCTNLIQLDAALDRNDRRRFLLLCKRRRDLTAKLARIPGARTAAEV